MTWFCFGVEVHTVFFNNGKLGNYAGFLRVLVPTPTRFTFIEALKKYGLCLLFNLNSPFPPTVTDCSGFTLFSQRHN